MSEPTCLRRRNLDLFRFSDAPIFEALHTHRSQVDN